SRGADAQGVGPAGETLEGEVRRTALRAGAQDAQPLGHGAALRRLDRCVDLRALVMSEDDPDRAGDRGDGDHRPLDVAAAVDLEPRLAAVDGHGPYARVEGKGGGQGQDRATGEGPRRGP